MPPNLQIKEMEDKVAKLQIELNTLSQSFHKNNFTSSQTFNKDCIFQTRLKVPSYTAAPTVAEVDDIIGVVGVLYICTSINPVVFTKVGAQ